MNLHIFQLICFFKKSVQWGNKNLLTCGMGTTRYPLVKNEVGHLPHTIPKNDSRWIIELNTSANTRKLLEEKGGVNLHELGLGNGFLIMSTNHK